MAKLAVGFVVTALGLTLVHGVGGHVAHPAPAPVAASARAAR